MDLEEFETRDLLQELIDRDVIDEAAAQRLLAKEQENEPPSPPRPPIAPGDSEFAAALDEMRCGRRREALVHLERALGGDWLGQLS